jgi:multidrug efflux pump subunit AcrA (membrane-fusion protein)
MEMGGTGMRKYVMLAGFTIILSAAIIIAGQSVKNSMVKVTAVKVIPETADDITVCSGKVESLDDSKVYVPSAGLSRKIYVKAGDQVTAGQPLMDVATYSSSDDGDSGGSYQEAYEAYTSYFNHSSSVPSSSEEELGTVETLKSPVSGTVESVAASGSGAFLSPSEPAVVIKNGSGLQVRLSVGESQISKLKIGQKAKISGVGFSGSTYNGTVKSISNEAKQTITTTGQETVVEVVVSIDRPGSDIKPGFTAKTKIVTSHCVNTLIVPYEAVREDDSGNEYVFRVINKEAVKTPIVTGKEFDSGFEVRQGISHNDIIIMNPDNVSNGAHVVPTVVKAVSLND